jgi:hypothetical protein
VTVSFSRIPLHGVSWSIIVKREGKRPLRRPRRRWEDNIKMNLKEMGYEVVNWTHLTQDRDQ